MKRSFAFFALVCAILFGCTATAGAQSKALKKDVKKRVKELTKEGWKPLQPLPACVWNTLNWWTATRCRRLPIGKILRMPWVALRCSAEKSA